VTVILAAATITYIGLLTGSVIAQASDHWSSTFLDLAAATVMAGTLLVALVSGEWLAAAITVAAVVVAGAMFRRDRRDGHGPSEVRGDA
jgi:hypothetical protein